MCKNVSYVAFLFFFPVSCLLFEFQGQLRADFLTLDERACTWRGGNRKGVLRGKKEVRPEKKKGGFQLEMEKKKKISMGMHGKQSILYR